MDAADAIERAAAAWGVGEPRIAGAHDVIHRGADGILRVLVGRRVVDAGTELVLGMIGADADVVGAGLAEDARGELVAWERLDLMRLRDGVLPFDVFHGL